MGTPLPPIPPDPGDLCDVCWGDDGIIGIVTPRVISITLFDLEEGIFWDEAFRDELFTPTDMIQNETLPCFFVGVTTNFSWLLFYDPTGSVVQVQQLFPLDEFAFTLADPTLCVSTGPNGLTFPSNNVAFNGSMSLYFGV